MTQLSELLPITNNILDDEEVNAISARDLHKFLGVTERFQQWITKQFSYGFKENVDYLGCKIFNTIANRELQDYVISLDCAKQIAMLQRSPKGQEAREYFIECEKQQAKALRELSFISYTHPEGLIFSVAGEVHTTSQVLAKVSGRNHYHVLRDIQREIKELKTNQNLSTSIKDKILNGFKETTYKDSKGELRKAYQLSEEAFLQLRHSSEVRARFVVAFTSYRDTLINLYKARVLEKVIPQISTSRSFIYIIREEGKGRLKIGISNNPEKRLKTLQTGSAEDLTLLYTSLVCSNSLEIESNVHEHFKEYLVRGEWFSPELEPVEIVKYLESQTYVLESDFDLSFGSKIVKLLKGDE